MEPQEIVERALAARTAGDCIAIVSVDNRIDLRWARSTLTTNGASSSTTLTVIAFHGTATGVATATVARSAADPMTIEQTVKAAEAAAREAGDAEDAAPLAPARTCATWHDPAAELAPDALAPVAAALGAVLQSGGDVEHFGYAEQTSSSTWLGSSTGVRLRYDQPAGRIEMTAKSHGRTRSTWVGASARDLAQDVTTGGLDIAGLDRQLRQGLQWQARRVEVPAGRHAAVLTPGAVGDLMVDLWWSASARDAAEGRSVFSRPGGTRIGELLSHMSLDLFSDPAYPGLECADFQTVGMSSGSASVFDNGLAMGRSDWLSNGHLAGLAASRATAAEFSMPCVARPDNLILQTPGTGTLDDVIARTDRGLLVTCLWYIRVVDPQSLLVTGLTRDGVYLVDGGEVVGSVGNFRFNESPVGMLERIADSGSSDRTLPREMADYVQRICMPALTVDEFNFSTPSDAL